MYTLYDLESAPPAPRAQLVDGGGRTVHLEDYWPNAALTAFTFTRHFG